MDFSGNIIYGLVDPRTKLIRYVGQTTRAAARWADHRWYARRGDSHKDRRITALLDAGLCFEPVLLERVATTDELNIRINLLTGVK